MEAAGATPASPCASPPREEVADAARRIGEIAAALERANAEATAERERADAAEAREQALYAQFETRVRAALDSHAALEREVLAACGGGTPTATPLDQVHAHGGALTTPPTRPADLVGGPPAHTATPSPLGKASSAAGGKPTGTALQLPSAEAENVYLHVENQGLKEKVMQVRALLEAAEAAVAREREAVAEGHAEREGMRAAHAEQLAEAEQRHATALEAKEAEVLERCAAVVRDGDVRLAARDEACEEQLAACRSGHARREAELQGLVTSLEEELAAVGAEAAVLRKDLEMRAADAAAAHDDLQAARAEAAALRAKASTPTAPAPDADATATLHERIAQLTGGARASEERLRHLRNEADTATAERDALRLESTRLAAALQAAGADATVAHTKAQQELLTVQGENERLKAAADDLRHKIEQHMKAAAEARGEAKSALAERGAAVSKLAEASQAAKAAAQQRDAAHAKVATLEDSNQTMTNLVEDLSQQIKFFDAQAQSMAGMNDKLRANAAASQDVVSMAEANAMLKSALAAAREKIEGLESVCRANTDEIAGLRAQIDSAGTVDKKLRIAQAHAERVSSQLRERERQVQDLTASLHSERERSEDALHALALTQATADAQSDAAAVEPEMPAVPRLWHEGDTSWKGVVAETDWVTRNRRELAATLWEMFKELQAALKAVRVRANPPAQMPPSNSNAVVDLRNALRDLDATADHVRGAKLKAQWVIANYLTEVEKLHLGVPVSYFPPEAREGGRGAVRRAYVPVRGSPRASSPRTGGHRYAGSPVGSPRGKAGGGGGGVGSSDPASPVPKWAQDLVRQHAALPGTDDTRRDTYLRSLSPRSNRSASPLAAHAPRHASPRVGLRSPSVEQLLDMYQPRP